MDGEAARDYFLTKPEAWLDFPFGDDVYVFKVSTKMFGTLGWNNGVPNINLKCRVRARSEKDKITGG